MEAYFIFSNTTIGIFMNVKVLIELAEGLPTDEDKKEARSAALSLSNSRASIDIASEGAMLATNFTVDRAKQRDIVDKVVGKFKFYMQNYVQATISFPK